MRSMLINLLVVPVLYCSAALPIVVVNGKNPSPPSQWRFEQEVKRFGERLWRVLRRDQRVALLPTSWPLGSAAEARQSLSADPQRGQK